MKKAYFLFPLTFFLLIQSCISIKKYEALSYKFEYQSDELKATQKRKENFELSVDSLREITQYYSAKITDIEQDKASIQTELDDFVIKSKEEGSALEVEMAKMISEAREEKKVVEIKTDTVNLTSHEISSGKVAFHCPREMYYKQTYDAFGLIADVLSDQDVKSLVIKTIKNHARDTTDIDFQNENLLIEAIEFYNIIELRLDQTTNDGFDIIRVHDNDRQIVSDKMEGWHWKVTPVTTTSQQQLILKVIVHNDDGTESFFPGKTYHLDIKIRPFSFFHNTKVLFIENPEWAFGAIILPLLTFLFGRYQKRKENRV